MSKSGGAIVDEVPNDGQFGVIHADSFSGHQRRSCFGELWHVQR
jgi:hypothetical protein